MEDCPSTSVAATTLPADQIGLASRMLSENEVEISTPPSAKGVKLDQLTSTRPVSGSLSAKGLSARSTLRPLRSPFGFVAGGIANGPVHVCPKSVDRWKPSVCAGPLEPPFTTMIEK